MAGLFDSLSVATSGMTAARTGLDVTGQNIANVNTPGYVRRTLQLAERPGADPSQPGRGVDVVEIRALRDLYVESRIGREKAGQAFDQARLEGAKEIEAAAGLPGQSLDARITAFFDSFAALASDVTSATARDTVVRQGVSLAESFAGMAGYVRDLQASTDRSVRDAVTELDDLAGRVADINARITGGGGDVNALRDERSAALQRMAELADVGVLERADGAVDVTMAGGHALVVGGRAFDVTLTPQPPTGHVALGIGDHDVTAAVSSGRIGGLLTVRDETAPGYLAALDQLAWDVATAVNTAHAAGFDANGDPGGAFFTLPAGVAGSASSIAVSSAIAADPQLVAGSATGAVGDNQAARAIADIRHARVVGGGTATAAQSWANFVYRVGSDVGAAESSMTTRGQIVRQLERVRDQQSAVSLDEEAANLMRYQRSYEASARYFTTIVDTLDTLMAMVRQ